jgi:hypothetical protein
MFENVVSLYMVFTKPSSGWWAFFHNILPSTNMAGVSCTSMTTSTLDAIRIPHLSYCQFACSVFELRARQYGNGPGAKLLTCNILLEKSLSSAILPMLCRRANITDGSSR